MSIVKSKLRGENKAQRVLNVLLNEGVEELDGRK